MEYKETLVKGKGQNTNYIRRETMRVINHIFFYRCTEHFDIYKIHTPTNALYIKLDKVLKFTLKSLLLAPTCFGVRPLSGNLH